MTHKPDKKCRAENYRSISLKNIKNTAQLETQLNWIKYKSYKYEDSEFNAQNLWVTASSQCSGCENETPGLTWQLT